MKTKKLLFMIFFAFIALFRAYPQMNNTSGILVYFIDGIQTESIMDKGQVVTKSRITNTQIKSALSAISVSEDSIMPAFPHFNRADTLRILSDGRRVSQADLSKLYKIRTAKGQNTKKIIDYLNDLPEVLYAELDGIVQPCITPNDTYYNLQWNMNNSLNPVRDIHAEAAWDIYTGNPNNIIAIIDGGVYANHEDLNDKITGGDIGTGSGGWISHGTHVAGIAAAESDNGQGVSGVDWNARIHPQRIDLGGDAEIYQAIVDAVNYSPNVFVLNNSYGLMFDENTPGRYSTTVRQAVAYAYKNNRIFVASMGNHQETHPDTVNYPAGYPNVLAVGATNSNDVIAPFSVHGAHIDVCAPGVGIYSTKTDDTYGSMSGTSMATPHVAGLASLLKGYNTSLANDDVMNIIRLSADDKGALGFDSIYGYGRINAERAMSYLTSPYTLVQSTASSGTVISTSNQYMALFMGATGLSTANYIVKRVEVQKTITFPDNMYNVIGAWGRGVFTSGWSAASPNYGEGYCEVVPGSLTNTSVTLRTYVYQVWDLVGSYLGYYPTSPSNVSFAYSVLGTAFILSGPSTLCASGGSYSIENLPTGATVSWSCSSNITRQSNQGSNPCVFKANTNGTGTISADITYQGNTYTVQKGGISVGLRATMSGPTQVSAGSSGTWTANASCGNTPYQYAWYLKKQGTLGSPSLVGNGSSLTLWAIPANSRDGGYLWEDEGDTTRGGINKVYYDLYVTVRDSHGAEYTPATKTVSVPKNYILSLGYERGDGEDDTSDYSSENTEPTLTLSPNPAGEYVDIRIDFGDTDNEPSSYVMEILNTSSYPVRNAVLSGGYNRVSVQGLQRGYHVVRIRYGDTVLTKPLMVE